jgi:dTDP-4-dehydrorhamnose 3,5-epimerase
VKAERTRLPGVLVIESPVFQDDRGFFTEVHHAEKLATIGVPTQFVQDNHSHSIGGVLRGLHFQLEQPQGKLVRPVTGVIFDVAVDLRRSSSFFGQWVGVTLHAGDGRQMWVPPGFAHGFLVMSERADVFYKCTAFHHAPSDRCISWRDPRIGIEWPLPPGVSPLLSEKDARAPELDESDVYA